VENCIGDKCGMILSHIVKVAKGTWASMYEHFGCIWHKKQHWNSRITYVDQL